MLEAVFAGLFGLLIGSFLNVCIYRMPRDLSIVRPRSFCPNCEHTIAWFDNIPVVTWLLAGGKCRHCRAAIPLRYPLVEALTGALFFAAVWSLGMTATALKLCVFAAILVALIFTDFEERILPDEFTIGGALLGVLLAVVMPMPVGLMQLFLPPDMDVRVVSLAESLVGAGLLSGMLWSIGVLYEKIRHREGLGFGDVKMVAMVGAFMGMERSLLTLVVGSTLGAISGLIYILAARKEAATYPIPFGSFIGIAALGVAFYTGIS